MRRSLFSSDVEQSKSPRVLSAAQLPKPLLAEPQTLLLHCAKPCRDILRAQSGLAEHHDNYHEFCRLLGRLKTNYQLSELVRACVQGFRVYHS